MRKFIAGLVTGIILATAISAGAVEQVRLFVNGQEINFPDAPPQIINNRTMVPAKPLAEALGAKVEWDATTRSVKVVSSPSTVDEWLSGRTLFEQYGVFFQSDGKTMHIEANGITVELPMDAAEVQGVSSSGVVVRGRMENSRLFVNLADLRSAGFVK